eukprot:6211512-Pleurochrysis_carterae.AAC.2
MKGEGGRASALCARARLARVLEQRCKGGHRVERVDLLVRQLQHTVLRDSASTHGEARQMCTQDDALFTSKQRSEAR